MHLTSSSSQLHGTGGSHVKSIDDGLFVTCQALSVYQLGFFHTHANMALSFAVRCPSKDGLAVKFFAPVSCHCSHAGKRNDATESDSQVGKNGEDYLYRVSRYLELANDKAVSSYQVLPIDWKDVAAIKATPLTKSD